MQTERCPGCGAQTPAAGGPVHPYYGSSPGCWAMYGEVLAREYAEFDYPPIHRLTEDSYAVQHPDETSLLATQSVALHLAGLHLVLEGGCDFAQATEGMATLLRVADTLPHFAPPAFLGSVTVQDVRAAADVDEHVDLVNRWAESVWAAWTPHHAAIQGWVAEALGSPAPSRR